MFVFDLKRENRGVTADSSVYEVSECFGQRLTQTKIKQQRYGGNRGSLLVGGFLAAHKGSQAFGQQHTSPLRATSIDALSRQPRV